MAKLNYPTLVAEMAKRRIKKKDICELLGISQKTLWNKIEGHSEFTLEEAKLVRKTYFDDMTIEELFRN
ncbi:MAG: XRE family transcriptional regulator [Firmicutes bacterium]|nr:XRE family transcriptional regulator [Bacillota bacterium]